ncbi:hypothetical protein [Streptomyces sp. NPDC005476]|uniref:hypothetical protein n=1 Tax=Streptomyces sp. NPDC005476 TaxID=3156882 RepID=UPI0034538B93
MTSTLDRQAPLPIPGSDMPGAPADEREAFSDISATYPDDHAESAEQAFLTSKVNLARTHPKLEFADRDAALSELADRLGESALTLQEREDAPVPGGVGYGIFYNTPFKTGFGQGTSVYWDAVCPVAPGGNVNDWLYVTAMSRAGKGMEAFVSYHAQDAPRFKVFDWARTDHWQIDTPWSSLGNYLGTANAHGQNYPILGIMNTTFQLAPGQWRNQTWLWNRVAVRQDLIYQFDYAATQSDQTGGFVGSWGPIVETFQPSYSGTNPLGCLNTMLSTRDNFGNWGPWLLLTAADSYIRTDNTGFSTVFLDPNYAFAVKS